MLVMIGSFGFRHPEHLRSSILPMYWRPPNSDVLAITKKRIPEVPFMYLILR
jgi:hypothetical protein